MTREEIENLSAVESYYFETNIEKRWYEIGYINGLRDADAEPNLERLWHDASEIPQAGIEVIIQFGQKMYDGWHLTFNLPQYDEVKWKEWCGTCKIVRWAYIIDLLPKGGKK